MLTYQYLGFFFPSISDHVTMKVKYIALSFSPSFPGPHEVVDVTLVLVCFYALLDTDLNSMPVPIFSWLWLNIQAHKNLNTAVGIFLTGEGVAGVILCPGKDHLP